MVRSILAVLAGAVAWDVLYLGSNALLAALLPGAFNADGPTDQLGVLLLTLSLSILFFVISGYITAAVAQKNPLGHGLALGLIQLPQGIFAQSQYWELLPLWYHLLFLGLLVPCTVLGAQIWRVRNETAAQPYSARMGDG